eukprot:Plantae.Rhodophyta-Hildenbrandia_rubra.ctg491.p1 GENE.Plantae.Rhodophyta-Hildenbrandia_rubra.ctg491~~Plantae.Rhodophyta-Hildenbrandia_rubra.ctg491.p1  ORF type:complete len:490 (+),score=93.00 Plantae.Rhodophyta-Hildenbrandia_rubra.ctg491:354-1823(+)
MTTTTTKPQKVLTLPDGVNKSAQDMQYAVRGPLVTRAQNIAKELSQKDGSQKYNFKHVTWCNIGNPQKLGQKPITFARQVLSCAIYPELLKMDGVNMPSDVEERVGRLLKGGEVGLGMYSESRGLLGIREDVCEGLKRRDGYDADVESIFLTNGASEGIRVIMGLLVREGGKDGILVPRPQYPLYSASLVLVGGKGVGYELVEERGWELDVGVLERLVVKERERGGDIRALVVINPGNPTGQVLGVENMKEIVRFCEREGVVLMADEVYQKNIYGESLKFVSFKKVIRDLGSKVELFSFHSVSKGLFGECGMRGGFMECVNIDQDVLDLIYKCMSVLLCPNLPGQVMVDVMMNPPVPGDESYQLYKEETDSIYSSLKSKALKLAEAFNSFEGISCTTPEGALYLFPQLRLPKGAHEEAKRKSLSGPDQLYASELLEETGICVVAGSGFSQAEGTTHIRTTFLPPENEIDQVSEKMRDFHNRFLQRYSKK